MIGLPYETEADVVKIAELAQMVAEEYYKVPKELRKRT